MKHVFCSIMIIVVLGDYSLEAQNLLYDYSFDADLQGWTPIGVRSSDPSHNADALWIWTSDGTSQGAFANSQDIISESGGGAALFDSDYLDNGGDRNGSGTGPAPSPQRGELLSPILDFSSQSKVILLFHQYYRYYSKNGVDFSTSNSNVQVSTDGGASWDSIRVNDEINSNRSTDRNDIRLLDISQYAANQASVQVKFVWDGDYYFWLLDDVRFYDAIGSELEILAVTAPDNYISPQYFFVNDSVDLEIKIRNSGDIVSTNIEVLVQVLDQDQVAFYSQSSALGSLSPSSELIYDFPSDFSPGLLPEGEYFLKYSVNSPDFPDIRESNNEEIINFSISDGRLKKVPDPANSSAAYFPNTDFSFANIFEIPSEVPNRKVNVFWFSCSAVGTSLKGQVVKAYLVELPINVSRTGEDLLNSVVDLVNFDASTDLTTMQAVGWVIGQGEKSFTSADPTEGNFSISLNNSNGMDVVMQSGRTYLAIASYINANSQIAQDMTETYPLYQLTTIAQTTGNWSLVPDYYKSVAAIYLETEIVPATDGNYCISAREIKGNGIISAEGPLDGRGCYSCDQAVHADWYYFDAIQAGTIHIESCLFGVDTRLFVYSGDCMNLTPTISGDDECILVPGGNSYATQVSFPVSMGVRHYFEWDNRWSEAGFNFEFIFVSDLGNCTVSTNNDTGEGSLRNAIDCASPGTRFISVPY
ncbi:MAG: hypothetical protein IPL46_07255 [Saprospiraceae bacterium]|nr:hypothetical protein [Saprospiraceae bacterium]